LTSKISCRGFRLLTPETKHQVDTASKDLAKAKSDTEAYAKAAKADALKKIDELDRKVEDSAAKSKGYFSSWFGGK
jgi:hypothetical protein